jgi:hypothetical protein
MYKPIQVLVVAFAALFCGLSQAQSLPAGVSQLLPHGYETLSIKSTDFDKNGKTDYLVVLQKTNGKTAPQNTESIRRPLLIFMQYEDGKFVLIAQNDYIVYTANQAEQCDPFLDNDDGLAVKDGFFTVQNAVACGNHWTDYLTFKYVPEQNNFIFHKRIVENWILNPSNQPNADALTLAHKSVTSSVKLKPVLLRDYRPKS